MEEEIKKQEKALAEAGSWASRDCGEEVQTVKALNRLTAAVLLVAEILNRWSTEAYSRSELEIERRAR